MPAISVSGKELSKSIRASLKSEVIDLKVKLGRAPVLAVVLVGGDPASKVYVRSKSKKAKSIGMEPRDVVLDESTTDEQLQRELKSLSNQDDVDGILLQLPLPAGLDEFAALKCIVPEKDVDGLHPINQGLLLRGEKCPRPCTPIGCIALIDEAMKQLGRSNDLSGLNAIVIGRSILVGKPMGLLLLERNCTVTYAHSRTKDLAARAAEADILIAAVGRAEMVKEDWVKPGAVVIDVGINRLDDGRLVGDVAFEEVSKVAAALTPAPGGVGPMTIAMLLKNTVEAAKLKI